MKKEAVLILFLISFVFVLGCGTTIHEEKGMLSYSIKGCINKQPNLARKSISEEPLTIEAEENSIVINHKAKHLCNLDIDIQQSIKDAQITVIEVFTGQGAKCTCDSKILATISPLEKGVYNLRIYKKFNDSVPELVKDVEIAIGDVNLPIIE
jgi:hypothetical protein